MTKRPTPRPSKDQLKAMTLPAIDGHIAGLRQTLAWAKSGPVHKACVKQMEVAIKVRALNFPDARSGR